MPEIWALFRRSKAFGRRRARYGLAQNVARSMAEWPNKRHGKPELGQRCCGSLSSQFWKGLLETEYRKKPARGA
jgi:hypothetical protein